VESHDLLLQIAVALVVAGGAAAVASRLGQSVILGYLVAGVILGPHTPGFVGDREVVDSFANIGVVLLLFTLGAQLSIPSLRRVGGVALRGAPVQIVTSVVLGWLVGRVFGLPQIESLFIGAVVSSSSTIVLSKVLMERGETGSLHGLIGFAWASLQDLSTILMITALTSLASGGAELGPALVTDTARAAVFLALVILAGAPLLTRLFEQIARLNNREIFVILATGLALAVAYVSSRFGLSPALGAFMGGIVLRESDVLHEIEDRLSSLRDIFSALFFLSMGMLLDLRLVADEPALFVAVILLLTLPKTAIALGSALLARYSLRTAILVAAVLSQAAEFSLVMAQVGLGLGVLSDSTFSVLLAGSAVTIVTASPLMAIADRFASGREASRVARQAQDRANALPMPDRPLGHAIVCGYGRAGGVLTSLLRDEGFLVVVIELDARIVRDLRDQGIPALSGNAANTILLDRANVAEARVLAVTVPDAAVTRAVVRHARQENPGLEIIARARNESERAELKRLGVREAVFAERELAYEMARYALYRLGVGAIEARDVIDRRRLVEESA
jgi:CPA2 family monovalent cation:H+ antiporter-2